ncbi:MAG: hypothetical protein ACXW39_06035 [Nitrospira sp.]
MRNPIFRSTVWVVAFAVMALLAVTTGSAVAHELQHAAHHNAGMHGSGICAWMCATAGVHVVTSIHSAQLFEIISLLAFDSDHVFWIQLLTSSHPRAPPAFA